MTNPTIDKPPRIEVEDLDLLEKRRKKQRKKLGLKALLGKGPAENRIYRHLLGYVRPYRSVLAVALVLAALAGMFKGLQVLMLEQVLRPILEAAVPRSGVQSAVDVVLALEGVDAPAEGWTAPLVRAWSTVTAVMQAALVAAGAWWSTLTAGQRLGGAIGSFFGLVLLAEVMRYSQRMITRRVALEIVRNLRFDVFAKLMQLSLRFFHKNPSGRLMSRVTNDLSNLGGILVDIMVIYLTDLFSVLTLMVFLYWKAGWVVTAALGVGFACIVPAQRIAKRIRRKEHDNLRKMGNVFESLSEVLSAQKIVKAFGAEEHELARFRRLNDDYTEGRMKIAMLRARTGPMMEIIGGAGVAVILWFGGMVVIGGEMDGAEFFTIILLITTLIGSLRRLGEANTKVQSGIASADRVATVLYTEAEIVDRPGAVALDAVREGIRFEDVSYSYDPDHPVLRGISFDLPRGHSLGIVGPTGSGKSTISDLLPRFFDPDRGRVIVDGRDVRDYSIESLRDKIAMVTQDSVLFRDTVAANIAYARPDTPREDIERVAQAAFAHEFILKMPQGYDTVVGERGVTLSGGERQRIAIARALLCDAPILILDEATSALDSQAEEVVQRAIERLKQGRTTITIAHRLSTVRDCDSILVISEGEILERGSHAELIASGGLYARLYATQMGS